MLNNKETILNILNDRCGQIITVLLQSQAKIRCRIFQESELPSQPFRLEMADSVLFDCALVRIPYGRQRKYLQESIKGNEKW